MDRIVVMKNRSNMNDGGEDEEANSELEARLYAEIYYSNEVLDKVSPPQEQYSMTTNKDAKNRWRNIADTNQGLQTNNLLINSEMSQDTVIEPQVALGESFNSCHIEVSQVDENNSNLKESNSENINKKIISKKGQTPKKRKSQNVESVTNETQEEINIPSLSRASKEKNKQVHETQSECHTATNIINDNNTGTEVNKSNNTPRNKKSKICQNDPVTPSKQKSHNNKQQLIEEDSITNTTAENERIISENPVRSDPSSLLNTLEEVTEETSSLKKQGTSKNKKKNSKSANVETLSSNRTDKKFKKSKKRKKASKQKNNKNIAPLIILTSSESSDAITETHSKYKVSSKKNKLKEKQSSKNDITSDSDDSILEVPVPPKPAPPLINLQDSDNESGEIENVPDSPTNSLTSDHQLTTEKEPETGDFESLLISDSDTNQTLPPTGAVHIPVSPFESSNVSQPVGQTVLNDATLQINSTARLPSNANSMPEEQSVIESEEEHIILNCTEIQKSASSLKEIKKMSAAAESKQVNSDDSMTESEANNWGQLAESRISLNDSETPPSYVDRVSTSENEVTADSQKNVKHKKSKNKKRSDNPTKESDDANKENNVCEFSGGVTFDFQGGSNNQEANSTDFAQALIEDSEVHPGPAQKTSTEKDDPIIIHTQANNTEKSPNKRKRSSDITISPSTSSKQARYSDAEAGPSNVGLNTPKKKNVEKPTSRNCAADYFFLPMSDELKTFYNESWGGERFNIQQVQGEMPRDPRHWAILDADLCNPTRRKRYWSTQKCKQCHSGGHNKASCPLPKKVPSCHMCGKEGHTEPRCPEKKCLTCGRATSSYVKTCEYCQKLKCDTCGSKGHEKSTCPDLWRRYHRTTNTLTVKISEDNNMIMKPANQLHCCNCARRGHDYTDCVKYRWSQHFPTPSYVTNYTDGPHYISNTENESIEIADESFVNKNNDKNMDANIIGEKELELEKVRDDTQVDEEGIIYSYTSRRIIVNPHVWHKKWKYAHKRIQCVVAEGTMPWFIQDVADIVPLEFTISSSANIYLQFTVRCEKTYFRYIKRMITMWLLRDEVDKNHIIFKELPLQKSEMIHLLSNKLNEAKADFGNPVDLLNEIQSLKQQVKEFQRNKICTTQSKIATTRLMKLECKLVMSIKCQSSRGQINLQKLSNITNVIDNLRQMKSKTVPIVILLEIMLLCNTFFGQYVPTQAKKLANSQTSHVKEHHEKCNKNNKKKKKKETLRRIPERSARYNSAAKNVAHQKSASISNTEKSSTDKGSCSSDTGNLINTITSATPIEALPTFITTVLPNPSIFDIHSTPQHLLPLPPPLVNPCSVNFMSNSTFVRPDNVGQENFLPLETPGFAHTDNNPCNLLPRNLNQDGPSTGISSYSGVQYQPFSTLGLPYKSHLNNIQGVPYQFCYENVPQSTIQRNQLPVGSLSQQDITDEIVCLGNNQVKDNTQSMQMQHQKSPTNVINTPNAKPNEQPILSSKRARRKEKLERKRQKQLLQQKKNNKYTRNINKFMMENARFAIQVAENLNIPGLTTAAHALKAKLNAGSVTKKDTNSLNQLILKLSSPKNRN